MKAPLLVASRLDEDMTASNARDEVNEALGRAIKSARTDPETLLSQVALAEAAGYQGKNMNITIAKIEAGKIRPPDSKLELIATALGTTPAELWRKAMSDFPESEPSESATAVIEHLGKRASKVKLLAGAQMQKDNERRIEALAAETDALQREASGYFEALDSSRVDVERKFLKPLFDLVITIDGIDQDAMNTVLAGLDTDLHNQTRRQDPKFDAMLAAYRGGVARSLAGAVGQSAAGAAAGSALGGGAAFATYSAVAAWASASTGTAISALSGAAAANATLAALGGGSLAAGGFGIAGGTAVLAGIVAAPALLATGAALVYANNKWKARETEKAARIAEAGDQFERTSRQLRETFLWAATARSFLNAARARGESQINQFTEGLPSTDGGRVSWKDLSKEAKALFGELLRVAAVTISVLPLPVFTPPNPEMTESKEDEVREKARAWNEAVIDDALAWLVSARTPNAQ